MNEEDRRPGPRAAHVALAHAPEVLGIGCQRHPGVALPADVGGRVDDGGEAGIGGDLDLVGAGTCGRVPAVGGRDGDARGAIRRRRQRWRAGGKVDHGQRDGGALLGGAGTAAADDIEGGGARGRTRDGQGAVTGRRQRGGYEGSPSRGPRPYSRSRARSIRRRRSR